MAETKTIGEWGEKIAMQGYRSHGYLIVAHNYRCRFGEIDFIAENRNYLVFAEVKLRNNNTFAEAREFVHSAKQNRIRKTAGLWLQQNPTEKQPRFDVIEIYAPDGTKTVRPDIHIIKNAF